MYLVIGKEDGHIKRSSTECNSIEENNGNKYSVFDSTHESKDVFKKYIELWDRIKNEIGTINSGKEGEYGKDFMKLNLIQMTIFH